MEVSKDKIKLGIKIGIGIGFLLVGYKVISKISANASLKRSFGDLMIFTNSNKGNKGGFEVVEQGDFNPRPYAQKLYDAMEGWGTNESKIFSTLNPLNSDQIQAVKKYFNTYFGEGESLEDWFNSELSGDDLDKALSYLNK